MELINEVLSHEMGSLLKVDSIRIAIENELYEICDREHSSCSNACPVYTEDGSHKIEIEWKGKLIKDCPYHKNGKAMLGKILMEVK